MCITTNLQIYFNFQSISNKFSLLNTGYSLLYKIQNYFLNHVIDTNRKYKLIQTVSIIRVNLRYLQIAPEPIKGLK